MKPFTIFRNEFLFEGAGGRHKACPDICVCSNSRFTVVALRYIPCYKDIQTQIQDSQTLLTLPETLSEHLVHPQKYRSRHGP